MFVAGAGLPLVGGDQDGFFQPELGEHRGDLVSGARAVADARFGQGLRSSGDGVFVDVGSDVGEYRPGLVG